MKGKMLMFSYRSPAFSHVLLLVVVTSIVEIVFLYLLCLIRLSLIIFLCLAMAEIINWPMSEVPDQKEVNRTSNVGEDRMVEGLV
jgi:hypothetical protein